MDPSPFTPFGDRAAELLDQWQRQNHRTLGTPTFLETGGSGALLASVVVRDRDPRHPRRRMIIKLCAADEEASVEPGGLKAAWLSRPVGNQSFPEAHLVEQLYDPMPVDDAWMMFQRIAGDGQDMVTLGTVVRKRQSRLPDIAAAVGRSLLADWNPDEQGGKSMSAAEFVATVLDRRLGPKAPLARWARDELGISLSDPWILLPEKPGELPNPLHLAEGGPLSRGVVDDPVRGRAHGDLHPGNIMVPERQDVGVGSYRLIDLTRFSADALLARDPVHLMLYLVAEFLPHLSDEARAEVLVLLIGRKATGLLVPQGLRRIVDGLREAPGPWLDERDIGPGWEVQWMLAIQACALMFAGRRKKYDSRIRRWFFLLAAEAAAVSLRRFEAYAPEEAVVVRAPSEVVAQAARASVAVTRVPVAVADAVATATTTDATAPAEQGLVASLLAAREALTFPTHRLGSQSATNVTSHELRAVVNRAQHARQQVEELLERDFAGLAEPARMCLLSVLNGLSEVTSLATRFEEALVVRTVRRQASITSTQGMHNALVSAMDALLASIRQALTKLRDSGS
ncbi:hypothetical protein OG985_12595 [Streptomyces sp. NBC_00289]|uniref:hypothetical protein n=1 Tax=Streptomyces sp. NBC_00289 TaxID=2975703 RepID=UPI003244FB5F